MGFKTCNSAGSGYGACELMTCNGGYNLQATACVADACTPNTSSSCSENNGSGLHVCNAMGTGYGACNLSSCNSGFNLLDKLCVADGTYKAKSVSLGSSLFLDCVVTNNNMAKCWDIETHSPKDVAGLGEIKSVDVGSNAACAVTLSGGVKCWGYNQYGRLGNNSTVDSLSPVDVVGLSGVISVSTSDAYHNCALLNNGKVKCWGLNSAGELGDGTGQNSNVPVEVTGLSDVIVE